MALSEASRRKQTPSSPTLLNWWRQKGSRPVWPGIASARVNSSEDPGRPASEITKQIDLSRNIGKNWNDHIHWSAKSLIKNQGGLATKLAATYTQPAAIPPMPWINSQTPAAPSVSASAQGGGTVVRWSPAAGTAKMAIQAKVSGSWRTVKIASSCSQSVTIPRASAVAITALDRYGNASAPKVLGIQ